VIPPRPLPALPPSGEAEVSFEITPLRRGHLRFRGITIARPDPLGLVQALKSIELSQSLLILPKRYPMAEIRMAGTRKYQPGGVALASTVGDSEEFVSLRDYRSGDPMRRIHWKSYARVGRPVVKEYLDEFFVRHALVLDTFTTHLGDPVFEEAVSVAASIAISMQTQESLLDMMFVWPEAYCFTAGRGLAHRAAPRGAGVRGPVPRQAVPLPPPRRDRPARSAERLRRAPGVGRRATGAHPSPGGARHAETRVRRRAGRHARPAPR
jgi:uncharacterized protein (DUF58 family)